MLMVKAGMYPARIRVGTGVGGAPSRTLAVLLVAGLTAACATGVTPTTEPSTTTTPSDSGLFPDPGPGSSTSSSTQSTTPEWCWRGRPWGCSWWGVGDRRVRQRQPPSLDDPLSLAMNPDRKSTRLNSSHVK